MLFTSCEDPALKNEILENHHEEIRLSQQVQLLQFRLGQANSHTSIDLQDLQSTSTCMTMRLARLKEQRNELNHSLETLGNQLASIRKVHTSNLRHSMCDTRLERIRLRNGKTYQQVHVIDVTDAGVSIRHQDGAATLRCSDLTPEQQARFGLDETRSILAEQQESRSRIAYELWVDSQSRSEPAESLAKIPILVPVGSNAKVPSREAGSPASTSLLSAPARTFGKGNIYRYGTSRKYRYYYLDHIHPGSCTHPGVSPPVMVFSSFTVP